MSNQLPPSSRPRPPAGPLVPGRSQDLSGDGGVSVSSSGYRIYYNEFNVEAATWLRGLIAEGLIPPGFVDTRSITDVKPHELLGYTQCHFFAGIAGWPLAFALAGWPATRPAGTGSCPCQPFSEAGQGKGTEDERHLWPVFFALIVQCRALGQQWALTIFGEQVASALVVGKAGGDHKEEDGPVWLDGISSDLESAGYTTGACVLGAHSVGAPHIRQRLYWLADAASSRYAGTREGPPTDGNGAHSLSQRGEPLHGASGSSADGWLADSERAGLQGHGGHGDHGNQPGRINPLEAGSAPEGGAAMSGKTGGLPGNTSRMGYTTSGGLGIVGDAPQPGSCGHADGSVEHCGLAYADGGNASAEREQCGGEQRLQPQGGGCDHWADYQWILCRDGKHRRIPTESALFPLADGLSYKLARRGSIRPALLKGPGNAIVPEVAALFVSAFMEIQEGEVKA